MTPKTLNSDQKKEGNKDSSGIDCGGEGRGRGGEVRGKGRGRGGMSIHHYIIVNNRVNK